MNFFKKIGALIYLVIMFAVGVVCVLVAAGVLTSTSVSGAMDTIASTMNYRIGLGVFGVIFILLGIINQYRAFKTTESGKVIAFQNPDGEVTVSLSAIEEYIKKIAKEIPDVKDLRSHVSINKKGINIVAALSVMGGANVPEVMERMQMAIRNKIQGMLGVEESINIKMNISKIIGSVGADVPAGESEEPMHVPYR